jgi:hypothetical protein
MPQRGRASGRWSLMIWFLTLDYWSAEADFVAVDYPGETSVAG